MNTDIAKLIDDTLNKIEAHPKAKDSLKEKVAVWRGQIITDETLDDMATASVLLADLIKLLAELDQPCSCPRCTFAHNIKAFAGVLVAIAENIDEWVELFTGNDKGVLAELVQQASITAATSTTKSDLKRYESLLRLGNKLEEETRGKPEPNKTVGTQLLFKSLDGLTDTLLKIKPIMKRLVNRASERDESLEPSDQKFGVFAVEDTRKTLDNDLRRYQELLKGLRGNEPDTETDNDGCELDRTELGATVSDKAYDVGDADGSSARSSG